MTECASCGRAGLDLFDVGCVNKMVRCCAACIQRHGKETLKTVADVALAWILDPKNRQATAGKPGRCGHCPNLVVMLPDGSSPLLCSECQRELNALREAV
jgi:hypothetical protein